MVCSRKRMDPVARTLLPISSPIFSSSILNVVSRPTVSHSRTNKRVNERDTDGEFASVFTTDDSEESTNRNCTQSTRLWTPAVMSFIAFLRGTSKSSLSVSCKLLLHFSSVAVRKLTPLFPYYITAQTCFRRWATKKAGGSTKNGRDSNPKFLGVKVFGGADVQAGGIIVRQRGQKMMAANNVGIGRDHTLFALKPGKVQFRYDPRKKKQFVSVVSR